MEVGEDKEDNEPAVENGEALSQPAGNETNTVHITEFRPDRTGKYLITGGLGALGIEVCSNLLTLINKLKPHLTI